MEKSTTLNQVAFICLDYPDVYAWNHFTRPSTTAMCLLALRGLTEEPFLNFPLLHTFFMVNTSTT